MKKNAILSASPHSYVGFSLKHFLLVMKLTTLLLIITLVHVSARGFGQKINLNEKNAPIKEVIQTIEKQSGYTFFYDTKDFPEAKVTVSLKDASINEALKEIFKDIPLTSYKIVNRTVVLTKTEPIKREIKPELPNIIEVPPPITVTGSVIDTKTGEPLIGVSIRIEGTANGVITDLNGKFTLKIPKLDVVLVFTSVGYDAQRVILRGQLVLVVKMVPSLSKIDEVVVVGFGKQKKATVTGSVAMIGATELMQSPQANISNALVGRMAGLLSVQRSGQPGEDQSILRIRGVGTFNGTQDPLIMVDGIETDNYNNIDPNEVESISILKDASATAVYGVRGANGVLIITTKRGKIGKPQVSYSAEYATSRFTDFRHSMNAYDYATSYNLAKMYDGYISGGYTPAYSDVSIAHYKSHDDPIFYPDIDWFPYMFNKNSGQSQQNLNISGGTDKVKYFVSLGYFDQDGLINHTDVIQKYDATLRYKRYNIRSNFDFNITKRFSANVNIASQIENRSGTAGPIDRVFESCWSTNPVDHPDPTIVGNRYVVLDGALSQGNPIQYMFYYAGLKKDYRNYLNSSVRFNYLLDFITKGLSSHATISYNNYNSQVINYSDNFVQYKAKRLPDNSVVYIPQADPTPFGFSESFVKNRKVYIEAGFDYTRSFGNHNITGLLLYNQSKRFDPSLAFLVPNGYQGIVGRVTYNYKSRYLAEANVGYNGTENFAPGKRFGLFPAYSLGWVASEEPFFPKNDYLTFLKFRGSFGVVGNDKIGGNRFLYRPASYSYSGGLYQFGEYGSNLLGYQGSIEGALGNPDLTWERAKKMNIGTELSLLKNKISFTGDYFVEHRDNILANKNTIPVIVAASLPAYNMGKMKNSGFEGDVTFKSNIGKFGYWLKGNYTYAHNVIEFQDEVKKPFTYQNTTGQRYGQFYGLVADGLFNTWAEVNDPNRPVYSYQNNKIQPGDIKYVDINGDGIINGDDAVPIGYSNFPEKIFGLSFGGNFKGFDFSLLFQGAGNVSVAYSRRFFQAFGGGSNAPDYLDESWSQARYEAGLPIKYPHFNEGATYNDADMQPSTFWTVDASYVRLKNAEIGYTFPEKLLKRVGLSYLRIFMNGSNLLTWDSLLPGADPESTAAAITNSDPYPVTRTINFGFNVKF
jgi:TonB-linked SusC/RagA family outer membrane protein